MNVKLLWRNKNEPNKINEFPRTMIIREAINMFKSINNDNITSAWLSKWHHNCWFRFKELKGVGSKD